MDLLERFEKEGYFLDYDGSLYQKDMESHTISEDVSKIEKPVEFRYPLKLIEKEILLEMTVAPQFGPLKYEAHIYLPREYKFLGQIGVELFTMYKTKPTSLYDSMRRPKPPFYLETNDCSPIYRVGKRKYEFNLRIDNSIITITVSSTIKISTKKFNYEPLNIAKGNVFEGNSGIIDEDLSVFEKGKPIREAKITIQNKPYKYQRIALNGYLWSIRDNQAFLAGRFRKEQPWYTVVDKVFNDEETVYFYGNKYKLIVKK